MQSRTIFLFVILLSAVAQFACGQKSNEADKAIDAGRAVLRSGGSAQQAGTEFAKAVQATPDSPRARLYLAGASIGSTGLTGGEPSAEERQAQQQGLEQVDAVLRREPGNELAHQLKIEAYFRVHDFDNARKAAAAAVAAVPNSADLFLWDGALQLVDIYPIQMAAMKQAGVNPSETFSTSKACPIARPAILERVQHAEASFTQSAKLNPDYFGTYKWLSAMWRLRSAIECNDAKGHAGDEEQAEQFRERAEEVRTKAGANAAAGKAMQAFEPDADVRARLFMGPLPAPAVHDARATKADPVKAH